MLSSVDWTRSLVCSTATNTASRRACRKRWVNNRHCMQRAQRDTHRHTHGHTHRHTQTDRHTESTDTHTHGHTHTDRHTDTQTQRETAQHRGRACKSRSSPTQTEDGTEATAQVGKRTSSQVQKRAHCLLSGTEGTHTFIPSRKSDTLEDLWTKCDCAQKLRSIYGPEGQMRLRPEGQVDLWTRRSNATAPRRSSRLRPDQLVQRSLRMERLCPPDQLGVHQTSCLAQLHNRFPRIDVRDSECQQQCRLC